MFHWICPECGREIMPAMKECPACDGSQAEASAPVEQAVEAVAAPVVEAAKSETVKSEAVKEETATIAAPPPLPAIEPAPAAEVKPEPAADRLLAVAEQLRSLQSQNGKTDAKAQETQAAKPEPVALEPLPGNTVEPSPVSADSGAAIVATSEPPAESAKSNPEPPPLAGPSETIAADAAATARDLAALISINEPSVAPAHRETPVRESVEAVEPELVPVASGGAPAAESNTPETKLLAAPTAVTIIPIAEAQPQPEPAATEPVVESKAAEALAAEAVPVEAGPIQDPVVDAEPAEAKTDIAKIAEAVALASPPVALAPAPGAAPAVETEKVEVPDIQNLETSAESAAVEAPVVKVATPAAPEPEALNTESPAPAPTFKEPKRLASAVENAKFAAYAAKSAPLPTQESAADIVTQAAPIEALNSALQYATPTFAVAPAQDHRTAILRRMKAAVSAQQPRVVHATPQLTLPGPSLPPQLNSVTEGLTFNGTSGSAPPPARAAKKASPVAAAAQTAQIAAAPQPPGKLRGWFVSLSVMTALLTAGGAAIYWALPPQTLAKVKPAKPENTTSATVETPATSSSSPAPTNSLSKQIEVTGIRFVAPANKKPEIHYLVVNHSPVALNDVTVYVTLRMGASKPGEPPLSRFSFRAPNVPPFESKEMTSTIEKIARELTFPEWQDVKAEISVGK